MWKFQLALFSGIICCLVKLNGSKEISNSFLTSEQDEKPPAGKLGLTIENSNFDLDDFDDDNSEGEFHKVAIALRSVPEPGQDELSRVRREKKEIDYSECGVDMDSLSGSTSNSHRWPWMGALRYKGNTHIMCGATIINQRFVMTSAICATDSAGRVKKPEDIILTFGSADREGGDESEEFTTRSIYVHPKNTPTYDYDVALLELEEPIKFNRYMRPICLPPAKIPVDSDLYKPQSPGVGLGWGSESWFSEPGNALKEVDLVLQGPDACLEKLKTEKMKAYFTDRMFCAAEKGPYLCMGDSGGPAMQSQERADGSRFWTQVGIISWGVGCGPEIYGFHSKVHKFVPWILSIAE